MSQFKEAIRLTLYTDGSGYEDGAGGWAYQVFDSEGTRIHRAFGAEIGTSTFEMEFTALLKGLGCIQERRKADEFSFISQVFVRWVTDCEGLLKLVEKLPPFSLERRLPVMFGYHADMHPRFAQHCVAFAALLYKLKLTPDFNKRNEGDEHFQWCDLTASSMRLVVKDFVRSGN